LAIAARACDDARVSVEESRETLPSVRALVIVAALLSAACSTDVQAGQPPPRDSSASALVHAPSATNTSAAEASARPETDRAAPSASADVATAAAPEGMATIPEGVFVMGGESEENTPQHEVVVARFSLDLHEVTMDAYAQCVAGGTCKAPTTNNPFCNALRPGTGDHPVNCIDWSDAVAYCTFVGKRLPTEREWEYAASGGSEQRLYSWGAEPPDGTRSCYAHEGTCKVASFAPGAFGLYDMTGNLWEWTSTWYGTYPDEASSGRMKVSRGGSWSRRFAKWMRNNLRGRFDPTDHVASVGFRCAKDVVPRVCPSDAEARGDACVRVRGTPLCPKNEAFVEGACRVGGIVPAWSASGAPSGHLPSPGSGTPAETAAPAASQSAGPVTVSRGRSPGYDADCARIAPGMPVAYEYRGGGFHDREPIVHASGCKKRDVGPEWTSVCCAN
jgi:formylglycine-generating enzyme required for sulfatase activity